MPTLAVMHNDDRETRWIAYVVQHADGLPQAAISRRTKIAQPTLSRWLSGEREPDARAVVRFARAFGLNVIEALVAAEVITDDEARMKPQRRLVRDASKLSTDELVAELSRRAGGAAA
jgi:transcriptional regulator with XRE-family HTH domain